jgi:hypothetical protein
MPFTWRPAAARYFEVYRRVELESCKTSLKPHNISGSVLYTTDCDGDN